MSEGWEVARSHGKDRRKIHIDKTFLVPVIVTIVIASCSAAGTGAYWYAQNEARLADQSAMTAELSRSDERQTLRMSKMDERWRQELKDQERRTERRFDKLTDEMTGVRKLLERIAFNTDKKE